MAASRYAGCPTLTVEVNSRAVPYLGRRIVPLPETLRVAGVVVAVAGSRIDNIAAEKLGLATLSWKLADLNASPDLISVVDTPGTPVLVPSPFAP